uniref:Uncharacterized protein n=1 Tax=viral metagenome TaxID=1070528 RepID=A0A2V0R9Q0_9ZZZZ
MDGTGHHPKTVLNVSTIGRGSIQSCCPNIVANNIEVATLRRTTPAERVELPLITGNVAPDLAFNGSGNGKGRELELSELLRFLAHFDEDSKELHCTEWEVTPLMSSSKERYLCRR